MRRILICELHEESDTFNPEIAGLEFFKGVRYAEGQEAYDLCKKLPCAFHGMIDAIEEDDGEVIPGISLYGGSAGVVSDEVYNLLKDRTEYYIKNSGDLDGVFVSCHGATVVESEWDACGKYLEFVRELVGPDVVVAASFDLHANITDTLLEAVDAACAYQTYPHMDFYETGLRAGRMGMRILDKKPTVMAAVHIPMLVPAQGYTSLVSPFKDIIDYGNSLVKDGKVLDFSVLTVTPWMDIDPHECTCIVIAEDGETACKYADELAEKLFAAKDDMWPEMMTVDEIIDLAERPETKKPVVVGDGADSVNSGTPGDCIYEALRVYERGSSLKTGMFVKDPETVAKAFETGVGGEADFEIGGKITPDVPGPLRARGRVRCLSDGEYVQEGPAGRGFPCQMGRTAVISIGNIDLMVCEDPRGSSGDPQILRHFGIEPTLYDLIVVKAATSFKVPYGPIAGTIVIVDTPGAAAANLHRFNWKNKAANMYPFDLEEGYTLEKATVR